MTHHGKWYIKVGPKLNDGDGYPAREHLPGTYLNR
jgi:hypothetical protein